MCSPANRVFNTEPQRRGQARRWLLGLRGDAGRRLLASQHLSAEAMALLRQGDQRGSLAARTRALMDLERRFMEERGVTPPRRREAAASALDVEDEVPLSEEAPAALAPPPGEEAEDLEPPS